MINLTQLPASDAERIAYAEGFTGTAQLFARIADLEAKLGEAKREINLLNMELNQERSK